MPATVRETTTADRVFETLIERQATIFDTIRTNSDRSHRFTRSLLEATRQGSRDWAEVGRRFVTNPTDLVGVYEAASEAIADGQARTLALTREWIEDAAESQREGRELLRRGLGDARDAIQRAQTGAREVVERVQANAPAIFRRNSARSGNGKAVAEK